MSTNTKSVFPRSRLAGYLGIIFIMLSCTVFSGAQLSDDGIFRLDNNVVEVKDGNGAWVPVGGATVELVGELEGTDPWTVAGITFETRETTQIEESLEVGDLVKVRGVVLEDETWVAYSIELAKEQTDPIIILIGTVDSIDPWVVNDITLTVTNETDIQGEITVDMVVRVEILLLTDGTWDVLSIAPLGEPTEISGCARVIATILSVDGNAIRFLGWPAPVTLQEDGQAQANAENSNASETNDIVLAPNQVVLAVICVSDDGQIVIAQIIILNVEIGDTNDGNTSENGEKVLVCHKPDKKGGHTLSISSSAVPAHLGHGDTLGACP